MRGERYERETLRQQSRSSPKVLLTPHRSLPPRSANAELLRFLHFPRNHRAVFPRIICAV